MEFTRIKFEVEDRIATLTLNHPEVLNATSLEMLHDIGAALEQIETKAQDVRCMIRTGAGRALCAGASLQGRGGDGGKKVAGMELESVYHPPLRRLRALPCPIVSAVKGVAAGIGMSFAVMGDLVPMPAATPFT